MSFSIGRKMLLVTVLICIGISVVNAETLLNGAGATFPYPIYSQWFADYSRTHNGTKFTYQALGSGAGIKAIVGRKADFGASDKFLTDEDMKTAPGKLLHIPTVVGAVVVTYNLPGIRKLKLTPDLIAGIFAGKIRRWDDPRLRQVNQDLTLPRDGIEVVHRSDGSGTTSIFTDYLSSANPEWRASVGRGTSVKWPIGIGARGNPGVATEVKKRRYSIGYVEIATAIENNLEYASIKNAKGNFVEPDPAYMTAAANRAMRNARSDFDFRISLVNEPGNYAYPIVGLTWLLVYQEQTDHVKGKELVEFLSWAMTKGQERAAELYYGPLPDRMREMVMQRIKSIKY